MCTHPVKGHFLNNNEVITSFNTGFVEETREEDSHRSISPEDLIADLPVEDDEPTSLGTEQIEDQEQILSESLHDDDDNDSNNNDDVDNDDSIEGNSLVAATHSPTPSLKH